MPDKAKVLCKRYKDWDGADQQRILVPEALKEIVFQAGHGGTHYNARATYEMIRRHFYYPDMQGDITTRTNMNEMALLMMLCKDEWGPWRLRPGPIHKGV